MNQNHTWSVGLDVGSVALKAVLLNPDGELVRKETRNACGQIVSTAVELIKHMLHEIEGDVAVGLTGEGKNSLNFVDQAYLENDLVSAAKAVSVRYPDVRGMVEVGGHQSKWATIGKGLHLESFSLNDQCAAGSGAFLEQQAGRLKMDLEEFALMAAGAPKGAAIAGRCSVFAKSDMIHQQQKGTPPSEIAYGLCLALARNFRATLMRGRSLVTPAVFIGGGALNKGLYRAFIEVFELSEEELLAVSAPQFYSAAGVAEEARKNAPRLSMEEIFSILEKNTLNSNFSSSSPFGTVTGGYRRLIPLLEPKAKTFEEPVIEARDTVHAYMGIDVGSVSTDFCLISPDGNVLDGIYLRTRGDPLGALREGLEILRGRTSDNLEVLGVGATGSGRHLAGKLLGADVVKNEITCQLMGASHILPDVDTILEIGGQDSKYASVSNGRVTEFVMNKICAAGTGSFLEEQGESLGVSIKSEFENIAFTSTSPADLGSQCTVFMDTEVVYARQRGTALSDILSGLSYSVAKNYLERVVAGRPIGQRVVFQGGVASNRAVVAAFENLLGQSITVHPYNRLSGAIGAAVAARDEMTGKKSAFLGLNCVEKAEARTFECKVCTNLCQVSQVEINGAKSYFGDICERYSSTEGLNSSFSEENSSDLNEIPDLAAEALDLLISYSGGEERLGTAGVPLASFMYDLLPFWATFLKRLGFKVLISGSSNRRTLEEGVKRLTAEVCLPIKLSYGHVSSLIDQDEVDFVFFPSVVDILDVNEASSNLCPFEETIGFMVSSFAADRLIVPTVHLGSARPKLIRELKNKFSKYSFDEEKISAALDAARDAQEEYHLKLEERGREVLSKDFGLAFALLGKPYNILDSFENLNLAQHIRKLGILPIPMQMLPSAALDLEKMGMTIPWRYNRGVFYSLPAASGNQQIFPIIISNFGCGPDAFAMKHFEGITENAPYMFLEFDEHRGEAGLITRLEAFIDEVSQFVDSRQSRAISLEKQPQRRLRRFEGKRVILPHFADHAWAYAGAMRFADREVVVLPPPDEETLSYGEEISSGKECHPYILIAGDLMKHLDRGTISDGDVFMFPGTDKACLLHEYASGMRLALKKRGLKGIEIFSPNGTEYLDLLGMPAVLRLGRGLLLCDLLTKLRCQMRPYARNPNAIDALFDRFLPKISDALATDSLGEALRTFSKKLQNAAILDEPKRPLVGVVGDIYTRLHPFGNRDLFRKLEKLGLEVCPASFLVDIVDFGWAREVSDGMDEGKYLEAAGAALLRFKKEMESYRIKFMLGRRVGWADEPGYQEVLRLAEPYVDKKANEVLILNVAKMVDFARRGAHGIINAISFHCLLGTVSASLAESVRRDHGMIPLTTIVYTGKESSQIDAKLEAFAHQVKAYAERTRASGSDRFGFSKLIEWWGSPGWHR